MIAAGMGPRPGEIKNVNDAFDALEDARMWLKAISQVSPEEFESDATADCLSFLASGIAGEIAEAQAVLAAARGRDIETEVEAMAVIGEVIGRE